MWDDPRLPPRFWSKVVPEPNTGCWLWTANHNNSRYGMFGVGGRGKGLELAHRRAYESLVGPIPDGLQIDHRCNQRSCVNPDHLRAVTCSENLRRIWTKGCKAGHPWTAESEYRHPVTGRRMCRLCCRRRDRIRRPRGSGRAGRKPKGSP